MVKVDFYFTELKVTLRACLVHGFYSKAIKWTSKEGCRIYIFLGCVLQQDQKCQQFFRSAHSNYVYSVCVWDSICVKCFRRFGTWEGGNLGREHTMVVKLDSVCTVYYVLYLILYPAMFSKYDYNWKHNFYYKTVDCLFWFIYYVYTNKVINPQILKPKRTIRSSKLTY